MKVKNEFIEINTDDLRLLNEGSRVSVVYKKALELIKSVNGKSFLHQQAYAGLKLASFLNRHRVANKLIAAVNC